MFVRAQTMLALVVTAMALAVPGAVATLAGPVVLLEASSGRVLYSDDQDDQWYPASLTKIMTAYIAFEAIKAGRLKLTDTVTMSELAHKEPPSKLGLPVGAEITVDQALQILIVKSANDVAIMLAEKIGGSVEDFAKTMNATAKRLGMTRTHFVNPNGLPAPNQVTTARDLARLSRAALKDFPEHHEMWRMSEVTFGKLRLRSHNELLKTYDGADGLKTGFICDSGFNVVSSATRDGRQLIAVVLGEPSGKERNVRAASLLEHGFATSQWKMLFGGLPTVDTLPLDRDAKAVTSVRKSVTAWACNPRKPVRRSVRKRRPAKKSPAVAGKEKPAAARASTAATTQKQ